MSKILSASDLKASCAKVIEQVSKKRATFLVTKHGRPVARIVPLEQGERRSVHGFARGTVTVHGDIVSPVEVEWEAGR